MTDYPTSNTSGARSGRVRLIVLHSTETPANTARAVARGFQNPARQASAHWIVGTDATVSGVEENRVAWAAPGANSDGIQIEQCGYAGSTDWLNGDGYSVLNATALLVKQIAARWGIPLQALTDSQLAAGQAGIVTHAAVSRVYKKSDHWDPGTNYPMSTLINLAKGEEDDMSQAQYDALLSEIGKIKVAVGVLKDEQIPVLRSDIGKIKVAVGKIASHETVVLADLEQDTQK